MRLALEAPYKRGRVIRGVIGSAFEFNKEIDRPIWRFASSPIRSFIRQGWKRSRESIARPSWSI